jgi:hypothetical protein
MFPNKFGRDKSVFLREISWIARDELNNLSHYVKCLLQCITMLEGSMMLPKHTIQLPNSLILGVFRKSHMKVGIILSLRMSVRMAEVTFHTSNP